jgi:soluble lytic murein transglycosylase-like protein
MYSQPASALVCLVIIATSLPTLAGASATGAGGETVGQAICRLVESSARARGLPIPFLTRLIWQESSFRTTAISPVGAQGIAQFMPGTAKERGLADPFDPEQAIPAAASLFAGSLGSVRKLRLGGGRL